jgi:hypothetical protein
MTDTNDDRAILEQKAVLARSRLIRTLDALDRRREAIMTVAGEVKRAASSTAVAIATAGATAAMYFMIRSTRRSYGRARPRRAPLLLQAFETLAVMGLAYGISKIARNSSTQSAADVPDGERSPRRRKVRSTLPH